MGCPLDEIVTCHTLFSCRLRHVVIKLLHLGKTFQKKLMSSQQLKLRCMGNNGCINKQCSNHSGWFADENEETQWQEVIDLNLTRVFLCTKVFIFESLNYFHAWVLGFLLFVTEVICFCMQQPK
ncbi:uncharacterized protein LOC122071349 [Macadamia integrifolia]|uniref:uncharacterized protein LOC122071349 n=1 Tax=Macadamia integrifolia TaxID=60698 RepID=UPI001C4F9403|nr:uncharacterized protein LOC122071349 [Macadamia integrifolia]